MKKTLLLLCLSAATAFTLKANATAMPADTGKAAAAAAPAPTPDPPLVFSGSVDTYFKYDFSGHPNIPTSFASENNSISIGMIDLGLKKTVGNASFVGELSFGPRSDQSIPTSGYHVQNLYVSYNVTSKFNLTMGYMGTFIGYEVISPAANFNYSTSYLFTNGPFQNAGFKATYAFSDKVSLMAGIFNDNWNTYESNALTTTDEAGTHVNGELSTFGAQLTVTPVKNWTVYLNLATGGYSGTIFDLTTAYQITDAFKLGLNGATFTTAHGGNGYDGVAVYPQLAVSKVVTLGLRGEYFEYKNNGGNVTGLTATANIKAGPLTIIPEVRYDTKSTAFGASFVDSNLKPSTNATQFVLAAVYAF